MHLLIATPLTAPDIGGPATHCAMLENLLKARGIAYTVASFREVRYFPSGVRHVIYAWRLWRAAKAAGKARRLYALDASSVGLPALLVSLVCRADLIVRIAGISAWEIGHERGQVGALLDDFVAHPRRYPLSVRARLWVERFVLRRADRIIVPSEYFKKVVVLVSRVPESRIEVVYSGFTPSHEANVLTEVREQGLVVSAGRLVPWKGFLILIEAVARVRAQIPNAHLVIVGDGKGREELEREIIRLDASAFVTLAGAVSNEELQSYLARARVFALNTGYEGFSHQLLEAMDAGVPIVTTPSGGNTELIEDRKEGLLIPYNDVGALTEALTEVLVDAKLAQTLAYNAYRKARVFSNEANADRLIELLTT